MSGVFRTIAPPPPSPPSVCVLPPSPQQRRGEGVHTHSPGGEVGGRSIFRKTPDIGLHGLLQYNPSTRDIVSGKCTSTFLLDER